MPGHPRRALSVPVHVTGSWPRKSMQHFDGRALREMMGSHIRQPVGGGKPSVDRTEERMYASRRQVLMDELHQKAVKHGSESLFPINLITPLYFSISKATRSTCADDTSSENITEWRLRLDKGLFTLSVTTSEGRLGTTYEACLEGTYEAEDNILAPEEKGCIRRPTAGAAYGVVSLRVILRPALFEWQRLQSVEGQAEEKAKPVRHMEKVGDEFLLLSIGPVCDPECAIITAPYMQHLSSRKNGEGNMCASQDSIPGDAGELGVDGFTPDYIFGKAHGPEALTLPTMERVRPHIVSYGRRPVVGGMKAAYNCSPRLSRTLFPKDQEDRGPKRGHFPSAGLFHEWKKGMNAPLADSTHPTMAPLLCDDQGGCV